METLMESESATSNTKISDSGYSISCSNSNSQRRYSQCLALASASPYLCMLNFSVQVRNLDLVEVIPVEVVVDTVMRTTPLIASKPLIAIDY